MAWCQKCKYGSLTCNLLSVEGSTLKKCPQCGTVGEPLTKNPYKGGLGPAKKDKVAKARNKAADAEQISAEVAAITGGNVRAFDYEKLK